MKTLFRNIKKEKKVSIREIKLHVESSKFENNMLTPNMKKIQL